jgi:hypothetical protein
MPSPRAPEETEYRILKASVIMYWIDGSCTYHCTWTLKDQLQQRACMCSRRWRWEYGLGVHRSHRMMCCFEVCAYTTSQTLQARWVISAYQSCGLLGENVVVLGWKEVQYKWHIKAAVRGNEKTITSDLLCEGSLERGTKIDRRGGVWRCWQVEAAKQTEQPPLSPSLLRYHRLSWQMYLTKLKYDENQGSLRQW